MELGGIRATEEEQLKIEQLQLQTVNVTFPSSNIFLHGKKAHLVVWRRNEQTPLTNQHGQSPCLAEEKRGKGKHSKSVFIEQDSAHYSHSKPKFYSERTG